MKHTNTLTLYCQIPTNVMFHNYSKHKIVLSNNKSNYNKSKVFSAVSWSSPLPYSRHGNPSDARTLVHVRIY